MFQYFKVYWNGKVRCLLFDTADYTLEECVSADLLYKLGKVVEIQGVTDKDYPTQALGLDLYDTALTAVKAGQFLQMYADGIDLKKYATHPDVYDVRLRTLHCGERALHNRSVNIPLGVTVVESNPLREYIYEPDIIDEIIFSPTVISVRNGCFAFTKIRRVDLGFVRNIEREAFKDCVLLEQVKLSPHIKFICSYAFANCSSLTEIDLGDSQAVLDISAFSGCTKLTKITLPSNLRVIPRFAFSECSNLRHIDLPLTVEAVGGRSFSESGLEEIFIPRRVRRLGDDCFTFCTDLKTVVIDSRQDMYIADKCFTGCTSLTLVRVHSKRLAEQVKKVLKASQLSVSKVKIEVF